MESSLLVISRLRHGKDLELQKATPPCLLKQSPDVGTAGAKGSVQESEQETDPRRP
jgi:hypothetical protein